MFFPIKYGDSWRVILWYTDSNLCIELIADIEPSKYVRFIRRVTCFYDIKHKTALLNKMNVSTPLQENSGKYQVI
jgi:hypothetical protein